MQKNLDNNISSVNIFFHSKWSLNKFLFQHTLEIFDIYFQLIVQLFTVAIRLTNFICHKLTFNPLPLQGNSSISNHGKYYTELDKDSIRDKQKILESDLNTARTIKN